MYMYVYRSVLLILLLLIVLFENFIFHYMERSTVPVKGFQVRPLIDPHGHWLNEYSEGSVACHTYCVTGCWFRLSFLKESWLLHLLPRTVITCLNDLGLSRPQDSYPGLLHARRTLYHWATAAVLSRGNRHVSFWISGYIEVFLSK